MFSWWVSFYKIKCSREVQHKWIKMNLTLVIRALSYIKWCRFEYQKYKTLRFEMEYFWIIFELKTFYSTLNFSELLLDFFRDYLLECSHCINKVNKVTKHMYCTALLKFTLSLLNPLPFSVYPQQMWCAKAIGKTCLNNITYDDGYDNFLCSGITAQVEFQTIEYKMKLYETVPIWVFHNNQQHQPYSRILITTVFKM